MMNDEVLSLIAKYGEPAILAAINEIKASKHNQLKDKAIALFEYVKDCGYDCESIVINNEHMTIWNGVRSETIEF